MLSKKVYQEIASRLLAAKNCKESNNIYWLEKHQEIIEKITCNQLPSGSGIDSGVDFNFEKSTPEKLIFDSSFHVMNEAGMYDRWIDFSVTVKPSLAFGIDLNIKGNFGKNQDIKEYLYEIFENSLLQQVNEEVIK